MNLAADFDGLDLRFCIQLRQMLFHFVWQGLVIATVATIVPADDSLPQPAITRQQPVFTPLGHLPDGSNKYSWGYGISADGKTVVGNSRNSRTGFRWTRETGMTAIPKVEFVPPGSFNVVTGVHHFAMCVSSDGSAVAGVFNYTPRHSEFQTAFLWTARDGIVPLGYLPGGTRTLTELEKQGPFMFVPSAPEAKYGSSSAHGISGDGTQVVGVSSSTEGVQAFVWTKSAGMRPLGDLPGGEVMSCAYGVSTDGRVIVGDAHSDRGYEAVRWVDGEGPISIGDLDGGSLNSRADAVSADGRVIVGSGETDNGHEAFRWTEEGMVSLGTLPGAQHSSARAVSADGSVIVGGIRIKQQDEAFVWSVAGGLQTLRNQLVQASPQLAKQLAGWRLTEATGISADGRRISGIGVNPDENWEAWLVKLPPSAVGTEGEAMPPENGSLNQPESPTVERKSVSIRLRANGVPLPGLRIEILPRGRHLSQPATLDLPATDELGIASFQLPPGQYQFVLSADKPLPYVERWQAFEITAGGRLEQRIERQLAKACEITFRAVDVETGQGVSGVTFTRQNDGAELWGVDPLIPDNVVPEKLARPYTTDKDGVCRCLVAADFPWGYSVHGVPDGYQQVRYEEIWLKTTPGGKLEHTFKFRRLPGRANDVKLD